MPRTRFTPAQANKTLPLVRQIVADMLETGRELRRLASERDDPANRKQLEELGNRVRELIGELEQIGCEYKDWSFDAGLIDFPGVIDGDEVLLCWRSDEPRVEWYHSPEAGFAGRKPIPPELLEEQEEIGAARESSG